MFWVSVVDHASQVGLLTSWSLQWVQDSTNPLNEIKYKVVINMYQRGWKVFTSHAKQN